MPAQPEQKSSSAVTRMVPKADFSLAAAVPEAATGGLKEDLSAGWINQEEPYISPSPTFQFSPDVSFLGTGKRKCRIKTKPPLDVTQKH